MRVLTPGQGQYSRIPRIAACLKSHVPSFISRACRVRSGRTFEGSLSLPREFDVLDGPGTNALEQPIFAQFASGNKRYRSIVLLRSRTYRKGSFLVSEGGVISE